MLVNTMSPLTYCVSHNREPIVFLFKVNFLLYNENINNLEYLYDNE